MDGPKQANMQNNELDAIRPFATEGKAADASGSKGFFGKLSDRVNGGIERQFARLGALAARKPWAPMVFAVVLAIICGGGLARFTQENRSEKLWVPDDTRAQDDFKTVDAYFANTVDYRFENFVLSTSAATGNVLTPDVLNRMHEIKMVSDAVTAISPEDDRVLTYDNMCARPRADADCMEGSLFDLFDNNPASWDTQEKILTRINEKPLLDSDGKVFVLDRVLGGIVTDASGQVTTARGIRISLLLKYDYTESASKGRVDKDGDEWEKEWLDAMDDIANTYSSKPEGLEFSRMALRSFSDEFGKTIGVDVQLLQVAIFLIFGYAVFMLSNWHYGCVGTRGMLVMGGIISIGLAILASYGLASAFGLFFSGLMSVLPFLMIGIGVDDMFVLVNAYDLVNPEEYPSIGDRLSRSLSKAGASVMVTSLTDCVAFLIGSNTSLPALRNFSLYAAFGIFFDFLFQITFFVGCMVLDERRQAASRLDWFACFRGNKNRGGCCSRFKPAGFVRNTLGKLGRGLGATWAKAGVLLTWAVLLGTAIYGVVDMEVDADVDDFIPEGYLKDYLSVQDDFFTEVGPAYAVYMSEVDWTAAETPARMASLVGAMEGNQHTVSSTVEAWYPAFTTYAADNGIALDAGNFYTQVGAWLDGPGKSWANNIIWKAPGTPGAQGIEIARFEANFEKVDKSMDKVKSMDTIREDVDASAGGAYTVFAFSDDFLQYEQYAVIGKEAVRNVGFTMLMVFIVVQIMLCAPLTAAFTFATIASSIVQLLGFMSLWGYTLDSVVVIFVVISLGLAVDYSAHVAHTFLDAQGTPNERLATALTETGGAVLNGAISTMLGVLVLGMSLSYVFQTFFAALFLVVSFGCFNGLVVLPVMLSIARPPSRGHEQAVPPTPVTSRMAQPGDGKDGEEKVTLA